MGSNTIRRGLVLRAAFFAASLSGTLLLFIYTQWVVTPVLLGIVTLFAVISLIRYAERSERNFQSFLHAIRYKDYTYLQTMSRRKAHVHYRMLFEEVMDEFRKLKAERESHHESMQLVLQQLEAGVICFERESGKILFINPAALEIFGKPHITHFYTLEHSRPELFAGVSALQPGKPDVLSAVVREKISTLAAHVKDFRMLNTDMRLIILQNIKNELDNQEILSWRQLIFLFAEKKYIRIVYEKPIIQLAPEDRTLQ